MDLLWLIRLIPMNLSINSFEIFIFLLSIKNYKFIKKLFKFLNNYIN